MAPELIRGCQCPETANAGRCALGCDREMTGEDFLCDACRWAEKNGGCWCHYSALDAYRLKLQAETGSWEIRFPGEPSETPEDSPELDGSGYTRGSKDHSPIPHGTRYGTTRPAEEEEA